MQIHAIATGTSITEIQAALALPSMRACASTLRKAALQITAPMTVKELDVKLAGKGIAVGERMKLKAAMTHSGLLK